MTYPVTTEATDHPGGYEARDREFYDELGRRRSPRTSTPGRDVGVLCEGDPLFYGSYIYLHERLAPRYRTEVVPGVTSFSAAAASAGPAARAARRGAHDPPRDAARGRAGEPPARRRMRPS